MTKLKTLLTATASAVAVGFSGAAVADEGELNVVFINDGHVAPYHVAWLTGFEDALKLYNDAFPDLEISGKWLSAEGSLEKMI